MISDTRIQEYIADFDRRGITDSIYPLILREVLDARALMRRAIASDGEPDGAVWGEIDKHVEKWGDGAGA